MLTDLSGQIERITYTNEENGFTIARAKVYGQRDLVTVTGNLMDPSPGEILKMKGELGWSKLPGCKHNLLSPLRTNNYDKDVFNGDIGVIAGINQDNQEV